MRLICDPCEKRQHDSCAGSVRAFIYQDGPDNYACECYCAVERRARQEADHVLRRTVQEYERRYGREALLSILGAVDSGSSTQCLVS